MGSAEPGNIHLMYCVCWLEEKVSLTDCQWGHDLIELSQLDNVLSISHDALTAHQHWLEWLKLNTKKLISLTIIVLYFEDKADRLNSIGETCPEIEGSPFQLNDLDCKMGAFKPNGLYLHPLSVGYKVWSWQTQQFVGKCPEIWDGLSWLQWHWNSINNSLSLH